MTSGAQDDGRSEPGVVAHDSGGPLVRAARGLEGVHIAAAAAYFAVVAVATALEAIAFWVLVIVTVLRAPVLWRHWWQVVRAPAALAGMAWAAWLLASLLWSPDPAAGAAHLKGARALLLILAIAPIGHRWRLLLGALLAGISFQSCVQVAQALGVVRPTPTNPIRHAGLSSHPGYLGIFDAAAAVLGLSWMATCATSGARSRRCLLLGTSVLLALIGLGITAARGAIVGLVVGLPVAAVLQAPRSLSRGRIAMGVSAVLAVAALAIAALPPLLGAPGLGAQIRDLEAAGDPGTSSGSRLVFWASAWDVFREHPIVGTGAGGARPALKENRRVREAAEARPDRGIEFFVPSDLHSLYVQTAVEQGAIGLLLLAVLVAALFRLALRRREDLAIAAGVAGALVVWAVAAGFACVHISGRTAAFACALAAILFAPRGAPVGDREPPGRGDD